MIYLASPHSHADESIMVNRFYAAMKATAKLLNDGYFVYSPIVHCHEMAQKFGLPNGYEFWKNFDEHVLGLCDTMYVLRIDGWDSSRGIANEIGFATRNQIPIHYIDEEA